MARRQRKTAYSDVRKRVNSIRSGSARYYRVDDTYVDGNTVRKVEEETEEEIVRAARPKVSERTRRNRARAKSMSAAYVFFLSVLCACSVVFCVHYLQLRSELTTQTEKIASMESDLSQLQADNDAYYKAAQASVSMEDVKKTALDKLGMHYATESQIRYYDADDESYVRQYENVKN